MRTNGTSPIEKFLSKRGCTIAQLASKTAAASRTVYRWVAEGTRLQPAVRKSFAGILQVAEREIRLLSLEQKRYLDYRRLNLNLFAARCLLVQADRMSDTELREAELSPELLTELIDQMPLLRQRVLAVNEQSQARKAKRPQDQAPVGPTPDDVRSMSLWRR